MLIDFGTTGLPGKGKPSEHMPRIAQASRAVVGNGDRLTAVVATHRHADHISGFATDGRTGGSGKIIRPCSPRLVLQPWTEDPKRAPDARSATHGQPAARRASWRGLTTMNRLADRVQQLAGVESAVDERGRPQGAAVPRRGQHREQVRGGQPHRDGQARAQAPGSCATAPRPASNAAARREGARARSARSHADRGDSQAALQGPRSVLALRQRRRAEPCRRRGPRREADTPGTPVPDEARWFRDRLPERHRPGAARNRPSARRPDEQHQPHPAVRGRREEAAVSRRRADRELELRDDGSARQGEASPSCWPTWTSTRSATTAA